LGGGGKGDREGSVIHEKVTAMGTRGRVSSGSVKKELSRVEMATGKRVLSHKDGTFRLRGHCQILY
jgi:hypothetical protein